MFERQSLPNGGCPVQADNIPLCGGHVGGNEWAIDMNGFNRDECGDGLRAARSGGSTFIPDGQAGAYGAVMGVRHIAFNGGYTSTWYAHLSSTNAWDTVFVQGDWIGAVGTTGATGCHLHFQLNAGHTGPSASTTYNAVLSGTLNLDGFSLQTFSDNPEDAFRSNNTGPGYCRAGAPPAQDPGPYNSPCSVEMRTYARNLAVFTVDVGSTKASTRGPCGASRRWVKTCNVGSFGTIVMQNYVAKGPFGDVPRSLVQSGPDAVTVDGHFWKVYGRKCTLGGQSKWIYEWLGQPGTEDEVLIPGSKDIQQFQGGNIVKDYSNPANVVLTVVVYDVGTCTFFGILDVNNDPCYDVNGDAVVNVGDQLLVVAAQADPTSNHEADPNFNDRYDVNRDGSVGAADRFLVILQQGLVCK
jgi:hypothetical protein